MKKLLSVIVLIFVLSFGTCVFADEAISSVTAFTASLYYCDHDGKTVVLKDVTPQIDDAEARALAEKIEYTETMLSGGGLRLNDGTKIEYDWINNYVDSEVWFVAISYGNGKIFIPYFRFM